MAASTPNNAAYSTASNLRITADADRRRYGEKRQENDNIPTQVRVKLSLLCAKELANLVQSMMSIATYYAIALLLIVSRVSRRWIVNAASYVGSIMNYMVDRVFLIHESYQSPCARLMTSIILVMMGIITLPFVIAFTIVEMANIASLSGAEWALEYIKSKTIVQATTDDEKSINPQTMLSVPSHHNDDDKNGNASNQNKIRLIPSQCIGRRPTKTLTSSHGKVCRVVKYRLQEHDPPKLIKEGDEPSRFINDGNANLTRPKIDYPQRSNLNAAALPFYPSRGYSIEITNEVPTNLASPTIDNYVADELTPSTTDISEKDAVEGEIEPTTPHPPINLKSGDQYTLQRKNEAAIIESSEECAGDKTQTIFHKLKIQPDQNGFDMECANTYGWLMIQRQLKLCRERWNEQSQHPTKTIHNYCITIPTEAKLECIHFKKINKTSLMYIEECLHLKGRLINGRKVFIHIFGTKRIEPKRNVIKWFSKHSLLVC